MPRRTRNDNDETAKNTMIPQVLQRAVISQLHVTALDAGDVLECYYLTRQTVLHGTAIRITKVALGLRYRPTPASVRGNQRLELTIEYGPARAGAELSHESIPRIHGQNNANAAHDEQEGASLSWENEAKVYYTQRIDSDIYTTANYLASLSGTVLEKLLNSALDYVARPSSRRYQPFAVYLKSNTTNNNANAKKQQLLKSSNDVDFLQHLYGVLADLGVELQPVIFPTTHSLTLHAASVEKMQRGVNLAQEAPAHFFQNFYDCLHAIATANYSAYDNDDSSNNATTTIAPSLAPAVAAATTTEAPASGASTTTAPSVAATGLATSAPTEAPSLAPASAKTLSPESRRRTLNVLNNVPQDIETKEPFTKEAPTDPPFVSSSSSLEPSAGGDIGNDDDDETNPAAQGEQDTADIASHTEQAAQAAMDAQHAADAAGNADTEHEAVTAAQNAATAAQKAAHVTKTQAANMARDALLSGDGAAATRTAALCFSDAVYGLQQAAAQPISGNTTLTAAPVTTTAYLYWDGSFYYRVNLTAPYITAVSSVAIMPQPPVLGIGAEDLVDWAIVLVIVCVTVFGFLLLLQQIMGRNLRVIRPLYKYQRWFFQPTHYNLETMDDLSESTRGVGQAYTFGEDVIPLSMGGRRLPTVHSNRVDIQEEANWMRTCGALGLDHDGVAVNDSILGGMEMVQVNGSSLDRAVTTPTTNVAQRRSHSFHSDHDDDSHSTIEGRLFRDPGLVDLPDLKSKSKVAVPVSVARSRNNSLEW